MKLRIEMNALAFLLLAIVFLLLMPDRAAAKTEPIVIREESEIEKFRRKRGTGGAAQGSATKKRPWEKFSERKARYDAEIENVIEGVQYHMGSVSNG
jgi:hypothetical protein